jgi:biotin transport system substrate-specific component
LAFVCWKKAGIVVIHWDKKSKREIIMNVSLRQIVYASLFTALIIVGGYLSLPVPFSPVPLVLADFFALLAGLTLGAAWGAVAVGLYILLGALGLPVFAGGKAGLAVFFGPTAGFVLGYLVGTVVAGWLATSGPSTRIKDGLAIGCGFLAVFVCGVVGLGIVLRLQLPRAVLLGLLPYLPGTLIKAMVLWWGLPRLREMVKKSD